MNTQHKNQFREACLALEYSKNDSSSTGQQVADIITVPIKGLTPIIMAQIINTSGDPYDALFSQCVELMPPISLTTFMSKTFDDYQHAQESQYLQWLMAHCALTRVSITAPQDDGGVLMYGLPEPSEEVLYKILGDDLQK
jgi:hypothetical protein